MKKQIFAKLKTSEFIRFCVVGIICTAIDVSIFYAIHKFTGYKIAMISGFSVSLSINYILNIYWSFKTKPSIINAITIIIAHCLNIFVVRMTLMWFFINLTNLSDSIAFIPTILLSVISNFLIIRIIARKL